MKNTKKIAGKCLKKDVIKQNSGKQNRTKRDIISTGVAIYKLLKIKASFIGQLVKNKINNMTDFD